MNKSIFLSLISLVFLMNACAQENKPKSAMSVNKPASTQSIPESEWKKRLSPEQYYVLREKGTERPFSGEFLMTKDKGTYSCVGCGAALFTDDMKFESHCGWPSFDCELAGNKIKQTVDLSHGMERIEITCAQCGGHLGHIFDDGPTETGKRYCVNSLSLSFEPLQDTLSSPGTDTLTLGGGCFWCIEAIFNDLKGVKSVSSGYSGGKTQNPTYKEVCSGTTGHAEVIQLVYEPALIRMEEILEVFFTLHDPTTLNRQGADVGTQYRSVIFYRNAAQKKTAEEVIAVLNQQKVFESPIVTELSAFTAFYPAENYHQEYYSLHQEEPYCKMVIKPKMDKLHKVFKEKLKVKTQ